MNRSLFRLWLIACASLLTLSVACGPNTGFKLPDDYVALSDSDIEWREYDWKAVNTEGAVVILRERDNEQEGSLDFWVKALERELSEGRGYQLLDITDVETRNMKGKQLNFQADYAGTPYRYNLAVFLADGKDCIVTIETATRLEDWEAHQASLEAIIKSAEY